MKHGFYYFTKAGLIVFCLLFINSCNLPDCNGPGAISRLPKDPYPYKIVSKSSPSLLTFGELSSLLKQHGKETLASQKASKLFSSPFIDNTYFKTYGLPKTKHYQNLGQALRISTWNIENSIKISDITEALHSEKFFITNLKPGARAKKSVYEKALRQRAALAASDILLCQEMDIGHCRSNYLFAARHLAKKLGMNFVYAPQQLEIDPVYLGLHDIQFDNKNLASHNCNNLKTSSNDYKGVFGVAVLSRYPIKRVQVFPLKNQSYDWYTGEIQKPDFLEKLRRYGTEKLFKFRPVREIKTGGRGFTRVDLHIPDLPHETLTVINIHLEIKATPKKRLAQLKEILSYIEGIENPVVMAGDFNNASRDISATSLTRASSRTVSNPRNILSTILHISDANVFSRTKNVANSVKNFKNPLAINIPAILPNKKKSLFKLIENYRFSDGGAFDFRGDKTRSICGYHGTLSNSNQKTYFKKFTFTFSTPQTLGPIGRDRLDWIFVKSLLTHPKDKKGPYQLAPHFGETLNLVNSAVKERYSDHHPITILLPIEEPKL